MEQSIKYREALGLTQDQSAQLLKIHKSLLGTFEIGQRDLSGPIKLQFVHVLETEVEDEERTSKDFIKILKIKAEKELIKYGKLAQIKLELKIKSIKSYKTTLEEEVKKYQK